MFGPGKDLNQFMEGLTKTPLVCPKCGNSFTFEEGVIGAKKRGIKEAVLMCNKCKSLFSGDGVLSTRTLSIDLTDKYK